MHKPKQLIFLNSLRGLAAIYVLIFHARWLLSESFSNRTYTAHEDFLGKFFDVLFSFFRFGHEAVIFFFVLSGFLIHYSTIKGNSSLIQKQGIFWINFYIKRINRIYPPLIFALFFTLLIDFIGKNMIGFHVYDTGSKYFTLFLSTENFSLPVLIGNLVNVQGLLCRSFGSDIVLWSLSFEWWFYLLFPFFYLIHQKSMIAGALVQIILFIISVFFSGQLDLPILSAVFSKMLIWWLGVLLAEIYAGNIQVSTFLLSFLVLTIPVAILWFSQDYLMGDLLWGIGFVGFFCFLFSLPGEHIILRIINKLSGSANFSFTLYLLHLPILYLFHAYLIEHNGGQLPYSYIWVFSVSITIILLARWLAKWLENIKPLKTLKVFEFASEV